MLSSVCSRQFLCAFVGFLLVCSGTLLTSFWPSIFKSIVAKVLVLRPGGFNFLMWETAPVSIHMDFYFFNWTNPGEFMDKGMKPHFVEIGPYRYIQTRDKKDVVWNSNSTISFKQERVWYFDAENSNGSNSDFVTTLNALALSAAYVTRNWNFFLLLTVGHVLQGEPIAITRNVSELLFDGYSDKIFNLAALGSMVNMLEMPFDKFAWFYGRNGSKDFEGLYNMATGADDIEEVGELRQLNYENRTKYYSGNCGVVRGWTGERFAPWRTKTEPLRAYSREICRSLEFDYTDEVIIEGITGYRYEAGAKAMDNGTLDPSNECYCGGECIPSGVLNVSACQHNSPGFVSYPHFLNADPYYLNLVDGLKPDPMKHTFYATIEPTTGLPLDVAGRLQINILVQPYRSISPYRNLPKIFFPMLWFEERATITPRLALYVKILLLSSPVGIALSIILTVVGVTIVMIVVAQFYSKRRKSYKADITSPNSERHTISPLMAMKKDLSQYDDSSSRLVPSSRPIYITENSTRSDSKV